MLDTFKPYPFERLRTLFADIAHPAGDIYNLTIGEPQFSTPRSIVSSWQDNASLLNKYPHSSGETFLKNALLAFLQTRFNISLTQQQIIPTFGTREVLFNFPQFYLFGMENPAIAYPNPFYQIYEGAAIAAKANILLMNIHPQNHFKPTLTKAQLDAVNLVILNSPNNPTGRILGLGELGEWVKLALKHHFVVLNDECYSEIYENTPPPSILQASIQVGNADFKNVLAINSISKRSSAPGLRSGFIAGDADILKGYSLYRTYLGCALPLPLQKAASIAWSDSESANAIRTIYAQNLSLAREILALKDTELSPYTFYVWLKVGDGNKGDDEAFARFAYKHSGILVLPGSYLARNGIAKDFVRIALVYDNEKTQKSLLALKKNLTLYKERSK